MSKVVSISSGTSGSKASRLSTASSGGGGNMETRMIKVETDVTAIKDALTRLEPIITSNKDMMIEIKEKLNHIPNTLTIFLMMLAVLAVPQIPSIISAFSHTPAQVETISNEP